MKSSLAAIWGILTKNRLTIDDSILQRHTNSLHSNPIVNRVVDSTGLRQQNGTKLFKVVFSKKFEAMGTTDTLRIPRTIRDVYDNLPEGTLAQLIENQLIMSPALSYSHQYILGELFTQMANYLKKNPIGRVVLAPFDVHLDEVNVFQPDLIFVRNENLELIRESGLYGAPDLAVEILSPSTANYDLKKKKTQYEQHGVSEYWIVNPATVEVQGYFLNDGRYQQALLLTGHIKSNLFGKEFQF